VTAKRPSIALHCRGEGREHGNRRDHQALVGALAGSQG
jgi:hypothetical protein